MLYTFGEHYKNHQFSQILYHAVLWLIQTLVPYMTAITDEIYHPSFQVGFRNLLVGLSKISKYLIFLLFVLRYKGTGQVLRHNQFEVHSKSIQVLFHPLIKRLW